MDAREVAPELVLDYARNIVDLLVANPPQLLVAMAVIESLGRRHTRGTIDTGLGNQTTWWLPVFENTVEVGRNLVADGIMDRTAATKSCMGRLERKE